MCTCKTGVWLKLKDSHKSSLGSQPGPQAHQGPFAAFRECGREACSGECRRKAQVQILNGIGSLRPFSFSASALSQHRGKLEKPDKLPSYGFQHLGNTTLVATSHLAANTWNNSFFFLKHFCFHLFNNLLKWSRYILWIQCTLLHIMKQLFFFSCHTKYLAQVHCVQNEKKNLNTNISFIAFHW